MAFTYKKRDASALEKRAKQQGTDFQGIIPPDVKVYTVKKGDNYIRILPPTWDDADHYGLDVWVHYGIGPDKASVLCLHKMDNSPCPLCEAQMRADRAGDEELAKELKPGRRVLVWILDRNDEAAGPQAWTMPWTLDRDICKVSRDKHTGAIYAIDDPYDGYDISFEKEGEGLTTKYTGIQLARKASSVDQETLEFIKELPLPDILVKRDYAELQTLFAGSGMEKEETPSRREPARREAVHREELPQRDAPPARRPLPARSETPTRGAPLDDDDIPFDKGSPREAAPTRREPTRSSELEAPTPSGASRAAELRERLKNRGK